MAKVLVIDDEKDIAEIVQLVLQLGGHQVRQCNEPDAAVDTALEYKPDLILLDVVMPGIDGYDVFHELKGNAALKETPVAFLTSNNKSVDLMVGLHVMKAEDYITKPFGKQELLDRVNALLKKHGKA
jgi:two-component system, OmpR family, response regulator VicR